MRLNFNVLWVDDQPARVQAQIDAIAKQMQAEGFQFNPTVYRSLDEIRSATSTDVFSDEVDLILVDWDLGDGAKGHDAIAEIRTTIQYKDVVFYSAQTEPEVLRKAAFDRGLEGIYCANRGELVDEVMGVFESLVKKVLDLDHTRGIVMGATSDIDHMVNECLIAIHEKLDEAARNAMLKDVLKLIDEKVSELTKRAKDLQGATAMAPIFEAHMIFTANDRLRILSRALKGKDVKGPEGARTAVVTYIEKVVPERNNLGHLVLLPKGKPKGVVNGEGKIVSLDETRELRKLILGLRDDFRNLLAALQ